MGISSYNVENDIYIYISDVFFFTLSYSFSFRYILNALLLQDGGKSSILTRSDLFFAVGSDDDFDSFSSAWMIT